MKGRGEIVMLQREGGEEERTKGNNCDRIYSNRMEGVGDQMIKSMMDVVHGCHCHFPSSRILPTTTIRVEKDCVPKRCLSILSHMLPEPVALYALLKIPASAGLCIQ